MREPKGSVGRAEGKSIPPLGMLVNPFTIEPTNTSLIFAPAAAAKSPNGNCIGSGALLTTSTTSGTSENPGTIRPGPDGVPGSLENATKSLLPGKREVSLQRLRSL